VKSLNNSELKDVQTSYSHCLVDRGKRAELDDLKGLKRQRRAPLVSKRTTNTREKKITKGGKEAGRARGL